MSTKMKTLKIDVVATLDTRSAKLFRTAKDIASKDGLTHVVLLDTHSTVKRLLTQKKDNPLTTNEKKILKACKKAVKLGVTDLLTI